MKRILTVDDSRMMREMLLMTLREAGFHVVQAEDGQAGVDVLIEASPDVIITDINMPRMDGYGFIARGPPRPGVPLDADPGALHRGRAGEKAAREAGRRHGLDRQAVRRRKAHRRHSSRQPVI